MRPEAQGAREAFGTPSGVEWERFLAWAGREGWRIPARELTLYRNELADSAFVLRDEQGGPLGFVTVCRHQRSGWIGNLIVDPARRGAGFGRRLFRHAVATLSACGAGTLWLTASAAGQPLYENCGFKEAGRVERWICGHFDATASGAASGAGGELCTLVRADAAAWGYSRAGLLSHLASDGRIVAAGSTVALLQAGDGLRVLGPWLSADLCPRSNRMVLAAAMEACAGGGELAVDVSGGSPVRRLLAAAGFRQTGETVLMMRGEPSPVRFGEIVALASLGSMG